MTDSATTVLREPHRSRLSNRLSASSTSSGSIVERDESAGSLMSRTRISLLSVISSSVSYVCVTSRVLRFLLPQDSMFSRPTPHTTCATQQQEDEVISAGKTKMDIQLSIPTDSSSLSLFLNKKIIQVTTAFGRNERELEEKFHFREPLGEKNELRVNRSVIREERAYDWGKRHEKVRDKMFFAIFSQSTATLLR